jgi:two-component system nitrogen regulation sensor histidine kinase NtrY
LKTGALSIFRLFMLLLWSSAAIWILWALVQHDQLPNAGKDAEQVAEDYLHQESAILTIISNREVANKLLTDAYTFEEFSALCALPFGLAVVQDDSVSIWTSNAIIPVQAQLQQNDAPLFITESNGSYVLYQHRFDDGILQVAFLPLRTNYGINNQYLSDIDLAGLQIPKYLELSPIATDASYPVYSSTGEPVFYLIPDQQSMEVIADQDSLWVPALVLFLISLFWIFQAGIHISVKKRLSLAVIWMLGASSILYVFLQVVLSRHISIYRLFDSGIYASQWLGQSLGDLFLRCSIVLVIVYFIVYLLTRNPVGKIVRVLLHILLALLIWSCVLIVNSLVIDSSIIFNIDELFSLDIYTFVAILSMAAICLATGLLANRLVQNLSGRYILLLVGVTALIFLLKWLLAGETDWHFLVFSSVLTAVMYVFSFRRLPAATLLSNLVWLLVFSFLVAWIVNESLYEKSEENKRLYAYKKAVEKDPLAEYLFGNQQAEIQRVLKVQLSQNSGDGFSIKQGLVNQIKQELQTNYFKKYNSEIYIYLNDSLVVGNGELVNPTVYQFIDAIENNGEYTDSENLYFINDYTGNYYYLAELIIPIDSIGYVTAYIRLIPRRFNSESLYPELLVDDELRLPADFDRYNYAVYYNNNLVERKGEYSYPVMDVFYIPQGDETEDVIVNGYDHFIYAPTDVKKVVVSEKDKGMLSAVSYFSFLFFFFLLFYGALLFGVLLLRLLKGELSFEDIFETSLKNKVQFAIVSLVVFTFLSLGIATIVYITSQYNRSNGDRLLQKIEAVETNIDFLMKDNKRNGELRVAAPAATRRISARIAELSEVHDMDINIYNHHGLLITSSQPDIFEMGLISRKMDPLAYFKMTCEKETWFIHTEQIGRLSFLSAYVPVLASDGEVLFYLNLPYFATEKNLQTEISSFLVALVNVYVILLVLAALIALLVSRNITSPLELIAGTFRNVQLGKKNEPIEWPHQDEIGLLVTEYNAMLNELEKSARLLATSERESAWRDMAKQVAHEIKNPLTPMRLSIQHLQRAIESGRPDIEELTIKVSKTMMEQIDNLSFIASEFSNFAVMPKAVNEQIGLKELLDNVVSLFMDADRVVIEQELPPHEVYILADRNQILRVFNNLIKNATQAIPEDREGRVFISLQQKEDRALIIIQDNGTGIPPELRDKVFVPNFTTKSSGMGIGLAISKNIVESAGGYIWFDSQENLGTTFYLEFPLFRDSQDNEKQIA